MRLWGTVAGGIQGVEDILKGLHIQDSSDQNRVFELIGWGVD